MIHFLLFVLFMSFAVLFRTTMAIGIMIIGKTILSDLIFISKEKRILSSHSKIIFGFTIVTVILLTWLAFAKNYNPKNEIPYFLLNSAPFWECPFPYYVWQEFVTTISPSFHPTLFVLCSIFIAFQLVIWNKLETQYRIAMFSVIVLVLTYYKLWFKFNVHDYYQIDFYILIVITAVLSIRVLENFIPKKNIISFSSFILCVLFGTIGQVRVKYGDSPTFFVNTFTQKNLFDLYKRMDFEYRTNLRDFKFKYIESLMRTAGLTRDDLVYSIYVQSPNFTLSAMDQKGYSSLYLDQNEVGKNISL